MKLFVFTILSLFLFSSKYTIANEHILQSPPELDTTVSKGVSAFGINTETKTTPSQDSAYKAALSLDLPLMTRFYHDFERSEHIWDLWLKGEQETPWNNVMAVFENMPDSIFYPIGSEIVQHQINKVNALSYPGYTFSEGGLNMMGTIKKAATILGILEDVSPEIRYELGVLADVEIVIYSVQAKVIAVIFKGTQKPGNYKITWNGRDDAGKKMPFGDYIAEVRIGEERFVRKRIVID